jgi:hypothetical protein
MALVKISEYCKQKGICLLINVVSTEWEVIVRFSGTKRYLDDSQKGKPRLQLRINPTSLPFCEVHSRSGVGLPALSFLSAVR